MTQWHRSSGYIAVVLGLGWFMPRFAQAAPAEPQPQSAGVFTVRTGTRIPLELINSVSTKRTVRGDRVYLKSIFPVMVGGNIVIPAGSRVSGTITRLKRPGRVKGRGELFIRFDSLVLPNGVTREFRARAGGLDPRASERLDSKEDKISGRGNKKGDAGIVVGAIGAGVTMVGPFTSGIGAVFDSAIGGVMGLAAGLGTVLLTRGPDVVLGEGTQIDMALDRDLTFTEVEIPLAPVAKISQANSLLAGF